MSLEQTSDFFLLDDNFDFDKEKYNYPLPLFNLYPHKDFEYTIALPQLQMELSVSQFLTNLSREEPRNDFNTQEDHQSQWMMEQYPCKIESNLPFQAYSNPSPRDDFTGLTSRLIREMSHLDKNRVVYIETGPLHLSDAAGESIVEFSESCENEDLDDQKSSKEESLEVLKCLRSKKINKKTAKDIKEVNESSSSSKLDVKKSKISSSTHDKVKYQKKSTKVQIDGCNNIVKNYGKAMAAFSISEAAIPYLKSFLILYQVKYERFADFVYSHKENIDCIGSLRNVLLINEEDSQETAVYKNIFKEICSIFLKYFAVNWIYNGKMTKKREHLNCRFHLMRRIANPSQFTYLK